RNVTLAADDRSGPRGRANRRAGLATPFPRGQKCRPADRFATFAEEARPVVKQHGRRQVPSPATPVLDGDSTEVQMEVRMPGNQRLRLVSADSEGPWTRPPPPPSEHDRSTTGCSVSRASCRGEGKRGAARREGE